MFALSLFSLCRSLLWRYYSTEMGLHKFYKLEDVDESLCGVIESVLQENDIEITGSIEHEYCYYVDNGEKGRRC